MTDPKHTIIEVLRSAIAKANDTWLKSGQNLKRKALTFKYRIEWGGTFESTFPSPDPFGIEQAAEIETKARERLSEVKAAYDYFMEEVAT